MIDEDHGRWVCVALHGIRGTGNATAGYAPEESSATQMPRYHLRPHAVVRSLLNSRHGQR
jgi:hypothetical protein